jgi:K(+)-stimulated pyrophosphate-energized sodium pump
MSEANGCSEECKEKCMAMYDENGKFIGDEGHVHSASCNHDKHQEIVDIKVKKEKEANGKVKATVTITKKVDGKETTEEKVFEGDDLEVEAKIAELGK